MIKQQYSLTADLITLGISAGVSLDDVKKAYIRSAFKTHPDKGGDAKKFNIVQEAYERIIKYGATETKPEDIIKIRSHKSYRPIWRVYNTSSTTVTTFHCSVTM